MGESDDLDEEGEPEEKETKTEKVDMKKNGKTAAQTHSSNQKLSSTILLMIFSCLLFQFVTAFCCGFLVLVPPLFLKILAFFIPN
jgi:hypothetical protein